jgi:glycosyltransferase involved in cell wall biosynthesis
MTRKLLTIIIPVRREEKTIQKTLAVIEKNVHTPHVICIADDTVDVSDRTIPIVQQLHHPFVSVSKKKTSDADGFGPALVRAVKLVKTPYTIFVMADMSDDSHTIDAMVQQAERHSYDIVCGSRYITGAKKKGGPKVQGALSTALNTILYRFLGMPTRDATNAFKLFKTDFLKSVLPKQPETGVEFSLQLIMEAVKKKPKISDIPTVWQGRSEGQSKVRLFARGPRYMRLVYAYWKDIFFLSV